MFRLNRNERSHWSGNGVHVESELVFMIGRNMQIEVLADKARKNNDKSGSVYKCFVERLEYLSLRVNQEFLDSTNYILHPELFFNVVSNNLVSLNEQEKRELMNKARRDCHFDDPLKKWW